VVLCIGEHLLKYGPIQVVTLAARVFVGLDQSVLPKIGPSALDIKLLVFERVVFVVLSGA
jgi:hypothetical protein